ncbi:ABC transporter ATP-binding protein [Ferroplasma sp.]|uniref:ABC transporter ATP-binding protein n=1 Tax=Ferroplasma sp. TaxID=2591003 RepID=UPI00307EB55A
MIESNETLDKNSGKDLLTIDNLSVSFDTYAGTVKAVRNVNLKLQEGRSLGILGESGSGKSTIAYAIMSLLPHNAVINGSISLYDNNYLNGKTKKSRKSSKILSQKLRNIRWKDISMIFQGAMNSFNPVYTIGKQIAEVFKIHTNLNKNEINKKVIELLKITGLSPEIRNSYPHELSGGMKQRAIISMALALNPKIIIADEPTTGLDVITQAEIISALKKLKSDGIIKSIIIISHDIGVVSQLADDIAVLYAGSIMEYGSAKDIYKNSHNPYTIELLKSYPNLKNAKHHVEGIPGRLPSPINLPEGCKFAERCYMKESICTTKEPEKIYINDRHYSACFYAQNIKENKRAIKETNNYASSTENIIEANNTTMHFDLRGSFIGNIYNSEKKVVHAVTNLTFNIKKGEIVGLVGESGSGKSTLAKILIGILKPTSGEVKFYFDNEDYVDISKIKRKNKDYKKFRGKTQMIFQDPFDSLNPKMRVINIVSEPIIGNKTTDDIMETQNMAKSAMENSELSPAESYQYRFPYELSGGERQRVGIARAISIDPSFIIADEPTSMLDVSLRASFMNKLKDLREKENLTIMYISHDIASVYYMADRIIVMYLGNIMEIGKASDIIKNPWHPYTRALIKAVPSPDPSWDPGNIGIIGEIGNSIDVPKGCRFYYRCIYREDKCKDEEPPVKGDEYHSYKCHFTQDELARKENEGNK